MAPLRWLIAGLVERRVAYEDEITSMGLIVGLGTCASVSAAGKFANADDLTEARKTCEDNLWAASPTESIGARLESPLKPSVSIYCCEARLTLETSSFHLSVPLSRASPSFTAGLSMASVGDAFIRYAPPEMSDRKTQALERCYVIPFCRRSSHSSSSYVIPNCYRGLLKSFPTGRTIDTEELHDFARQIARGMEHLETKGITHRYGARWTTRSRGAS